MSLKPSLSFCHARVEYKWLRHVQFASRLYISCFARLLVSFLKCLKKRGRSSQRETQHTSATATVSWFQSLTHPIRFSPSRLAACTMSRDSRPLEARFLVILYGREVIRFLRSIRVRLLTSSSSQTSMTTSPNDDFFQTSTSSSARWETTPTTMVSPWHRHCT
jgi:hypothetical protein